MRRSSELTCSFQVNTKYFGLTNDFFKADLREAFFLNSLTIRPSQIISNSLMGMLPPADVQLLHFCCL